MNRLVLLAIVFGLGGTPAYAAPSWQLPAGHFVHAKMPMVVVDPRPDSETAAWARNRVAYPDGKLQYRVPVAIQGGAYPFHYELVSGPPGMQIGQDLRDPDYGVVTWKPKSPGGPYTVAVKVTDQDLNTVTATWTVTATRDGFVFVDPKAPDGGDGSEAKPFNDTMSVFGPTPTDATYAGYEVIFRGGTTVMHGPESNGNVTFKNGYKPVVWLGYTGETVNLDFSHLKVLVGTNQSDIWIQGLNIMNARTDVPNYHFFYFSTNATNDRTVFFEDHFSNIGYDQNGTDPVNQACILMFNPGVLRHYFTFVGNTLNDFQAAFLDLYAIKYAVIDDNQLLHGLGTTPMGGFYLKSDLQNFSVRRNTSLTQSYGYGAILVEQQAQVFTNDDLELAYNDIRHGTQKNGALVYEWDGHQGQNSSPKVYVYRNTLVGGVGGNSGFPFTVWEDDNVMIDDTNWTSRFNVSNSNQTVIESQNLIGTSADGYVDADGNLVGNGSQYFGTRGHEIAAGGSPLAAPTWR